MAEATNCHQCKGWIRDTRITLPRKITGDLSFCRYICVQRFWARQEASSCIAQS